MGIKTTIAAIIASIAGFVFGIAWVLLLATIVLTVLTKIFSGGK